MLENLWFWISWPGKEKVLLYILIFLLLASGGFLIVAYLSGGSMVLDWVENSAPHPIRVLYDQFAVGLYQFSIFADNYVIVKSFHSSDIQVNVWAAHLLLAVFFVGIVFLLALASTASRFYFLLYCAFFIVILISFKLENILLFGWFNKETLFLTFGLFLLPAYYLHAFRPEVHFAKRFFILLAIAVIFGIAIYFFAEVKQPYFYLASYGIVSPLLISIVFVLLTGFEIIKGFLTIITQNISGSGKSNFTHFAILSLVYIAILILIFLHNEGYISWKIIWIDAVWILLAATIAGFWGFKNREEIYAHIFHFKPVGASIYLTLAIICFTTYGFFFATANDPLIEVLEDAVIFSQLAFSIIFFVYVVANFFPAMMEGLQVYKIIYKPKFMPYASAIIASLIGVLAFFFLSNKAAYYQTFSGYYINLANLHLLEEDDIVAEEYYELSNIYGRQTHFGNFALAKMAGKKGHSLEEERYLAISLNRNPTEFAFADLAKVYEAQSEIFDALFVLRHGVSRFPDSGPLAINFGRLLSKTNILDSAAYYYYTAIHKTRSEEAGLTNIYSLYSLADLRMEADSLQKLANESAPVSAHNNLIALAAQKGYGNIEIEPSIRFEKGIAVDQLIYNFNSVLFHPEAADSALWNEFQDFYKKTESHIFEEKLEYAFAMAFAKSNHTIASSQILNVLNKEDLYGYRKYDLLMAQLNMKYGAPLLALDHYENTIRYYDANVWREMGIALMEAGKLDEARTFWEQMLNKNDSLNVDLVREMLALIDFESFRGVVNSSSRTKYNFLRYRSKNLSTEEFEGIVLSMEDLWFQAAGYIELIKKMIEDREYSEAIRIVNKLSESPPQDEYLTQELLKLSTLLSIKVEEKASLEHLVPQLKERVSLEPYYLLAQAFLFEYTGHYDKAEGLYKQLGSMDAFCDECIIQSARYLEKDGQDKMAAYNILLDAVAVNKYSIPLNKAYVEKAIELGLDSYVDDILEKLEGVLSSEVFSEFNLYVEKVKSQKQKEW